MLNSAAEQPADAMSTARSSSADQRYWFRELAGDWSFSRFPVDYRDGRLAASVTSSVAPELPRAIGDRVLQMCKSSEMAVLICMLAGVQFLLQKHAFNRDITVGMPVVPRGGEPVPNYAVPIRGRVDGGISFKQWLMQTRDTFKEAVRHQQLHMRKLADLFNLETNEAGEPNIHTAVLMAGLQRDEDLARMNSDIVFRFAIDRREEAAALGFRIDYRANLYKADTVERIAAKLVRLLDIVSADPDITLGQIDLLSGEERQLVLCGFNDTAAPYSTDLTMHGMFELQAARSPEAVALRLGEAALTYGELDERANSLASMLAAAGAGPGTYIGIMLNRSFDMIVAMLGVLKAGSAYVPLDPALPRTRLEQMIGSLGIPIIVTESELLPARYDMLWRQPALKRFVCMDLASQRLPVKELEPPSAEAAELWDLIAETATDRESAGGFVSSYTRELFPPEEVSRYRDHVVGLLEPHLAAQSRVLEIGCGAGLLMHELAPRVGRYVGLDPSPKMQESNRRWLEATGLQGVELTVGYADEIDRLPEASFDIVLIASTAQFFPGHLYFEHVVLQAMRVLAEGGVLLVADLLDDTRREEFRASVAAYYELHMPGMKAPSADDGKLYCHPAFFEFLRQRHAMIDDVRLVQRDEATFPNELRFRCDVLLYKRTDAQREKAMLTSGIPLPVSTKWHMQACEGIAAARAEPDHHAYVIFTSGSTGEPKGVVVPHAPAVNLIEWVNRTYRVTAEDRLLFVTSIGFDLSVYDVFGVLAAGGQVRIASEEERRDPRRLVDIVCSERITFWDSAPAALGQLLPALPGRENETSRSKLRLVFLSGDWIPLTLPPAMRRAFPQAQLVALGGATEAVIWSNHFPIGELDPAWVSIPYGKPIQNAKYYILDLDGHPCPIGVTGELYIGGLCLAAGYHSRELTEQRFVPNPFAGGEGGRLYRTGDLARWMHDGNIEFLGRVDHQVKIRGYRIELGDIQAALLAHPGISDVLVTDRTDADGEKELCAYYAADEAYAVSELRAFVGERLPGYMVPAYFVRLDALPVTPNGKVDRKALPDPTGRIETGAPYEEPATLLEATLVRIWQSLLRVERIGVHDGFFDLGGHSMLAIKLEIELEKERIVVERAAVYKYPTIRELAAVATVREQDGLAD